MLHGTADAVIQYGGGDCAGTGCSYPGAEQSLASWADYDGCADTRTADPTAIDLDRNLTGAETAVERHDACPAGIDAELWRIEGGSHIPVLTADAGDRFWAWLDAHPKP